jgi:hypothetical protein
MLEMKSTGKGKMIVELRSALKMEEGKIKIDFKMNNFT